MVAEAMDLDTQAGSQGDSWPAHPSQLAPVAALGELVRAVVSPATLIESLTGFFDSCSAREPFTQRQANELLAATRAACTADNAECVAVLLQASAAALRCADAALDALVAAAASGAPRALAAVLASPELDKHMEWRGPSAAPMLAAALADAMKASLASDSSACPCFHQLLRALDAPPGSPTAVARAALAPHMGGVYRAAAAAGARGALQALLVCLPEHCDALDASALDAALAAGYKGVADDISLLLSLRLQALGPAAAGLTAAAAVPVAVVRSGSGGVEPLPGSPGGAAAAAPDVCVFIDTAGSWSTSPESASCVSPVCGASGGPAPRSSMSSMGSSSAGSDCGFEGPSNAGTDGGNGGPCSGKPGDGAACNGASGTSSMDGSSWGRHPYMYRPSSGGGGCPPNHPVSPTAVMAGGHGQDACFARPPLLETPPAEAPGVALRMALRRAIARDDVAAAAQLLTQLVDSTTAAAADAAASSARRRSSHGSGGHQQEEQENARAADEQLDDLILDLLGIAATTNAADCAHLVLTAVGANDDPDLQARASSALCSAAAAAGRCSLLRTAAVRHPWVAAGLSGGEGELAQRCLRAALLLGHHHTAVWLARLLPAPALVRKSIEAFASTPAWQLQKEASNYDAAAARAAALLAPGTSGGGSQPASTLKTSTAAAPAAASALVAAFESAWLATTGERLL